jgi:hypothetical protein
VLSNDIRYNHKKQLVKGYHGNVKRVYSDFICDVLNVDHLLCQTADRMSAKKRDHMKHFYSMKVLENSQQRPSRNLILYGVKDSIFLLKFAYHVTTPVSASPRLKVLVCSRCKGLSTQRNIPE